MQKDSINGSGRGFPENDASPDSLSLLNVVMITGLATSRSDARRVIQQGGLRLNGERLTDPALTLPLSRLVGTVATVGHRGSVRLVAPAQSNSRLE